MTWSIPPGKKDEVVPKGMEGSWHEQVIAKKSCLYRNRVNRFR